MNHTFCTHSLIVEHLGCFQLLAITNKVTMSIVEQVPLWHGGASLGIFPRVVLLDLQVDLFQILRNFQIDFQSGCTSLQSHQQRRSVPLSPHLVQLLLSLEILILTILIGVRWNLRVVLIYIFLVTKDFEHFFKCFPAIQDSSVVNS